MNITYEAEEAWHNRSFTHQRANWYALNGEKRYAFHEWTFFPHFGQVIAAAITGEEALIRTSYWLEGWAENEGALMELIKSIGLETSRYGAEECPYGPGVFPICGEFDDAVKWFEAVTKIQAAKA